MCLTLFAITILQKLALEFVASYVPRRLDDKYWSTQSRLLRYADSCLRDLIDDIAIMDSSCHVLLDLGSVYVDQGRLKEADEMYIRVLDGYEKTVGPSHISTFDTVNNLGNLYVRQYSIPT